MERAEEMGCWRVEVEARRLVGEGVARELGRVSLEDMIRK